MTEVKSTSRGQGCGIFTKLEISLGIIFSPCPALHMALKAHTFNRLDRLFRAIQFVWGRREKDYWC